MKTNSVEETTSYQIAYQSGLFEWKGGKLRPKQNSRIAEGLGHSKEHNQQAYILPACKPETDAIVCGGSRHTLTELATVLGISLDNFKAEPHTFKNITKTNSKEEKDKKEWQIRKIVKTNDKSKKFTFRHGRDIEAKLSDFSETDLKQIKKILGKSYSLNTFQKVKSIVRKSANPYGIAFYCPKRNIYFNPHNQEKVLYVEGRTDFLTAIELGLDEEFGIYSRFQKDTKIYLQGKKNYFILDKDDTKENLQKNLYSKGTENREIFFTYLKDKDLSDAYNKSNLHHTELIEVIESSNKLEIKKDAQKEEPEKKKPTSIFDLALKEEDFLFEYEFLIQDLIVKHTITMFYGVSGCGKSYIALYLAFKLLEEGKIKNVFYLDNDNSIVALKKRNLDYFIKKYDTKLIYILPNTKKLIQKIHLNY